VIIVLHDNATDKQIKNIISYLKKYGFETFESMGEQKRIIGAIGAKPDFDTRKIKILDGVAEVYRITEPFKFAARNHHSENTIIKIKDVEIGTNKIVLISGPCSVENEEQIFTLAEVVSKSGAKILRGGAFKPRSSPYSFQGLGEEGLKLMRQAADKFNLLVITEILEVSQTDIFQVGARNMQNFVLLKELGKSSKPVMLKRGISATIEDWLMSAEYILSSGNKNVILCERGIRSFDKFSKHIFDLSAIPIVHQKSHLPVIADPSHAAGLRAFVPPMARAAVAAGADGLLIEIHNDPDNALSDGPQALLPVTYLHLIEELRMIAKAIGRDL
jgi:3-deoxy-7-phosphoheptulonate synthase